MSVLITVEHAKDIGFRRVSRAQARREGLSRYFRGAPCRKGHIAERHVATRKCCECFPGPVAISIAAPVARPGYRQLISRSTARANGFVRFFTGKPCTHGHVSERRVKSGQCCECGRLYPSMQNVWAEQANDRRFARTGRRW